MKTLKVTAAVLVAAAGLGACGENASYQERYDYLREVAQRGAETHHLIASQGAVADRARCERAYVGLNTDDAPAVEGDGRPGGNSVQGWQNQIQEFFVDSCVSGKPKPMTEGGTAPPPSSAPPTAPDTPATQAPAPSPATSR